MAATSFAVVAIFQRNRDLEHNLFTTTPIAPFVAGVVLINRTVQVKPPSNAKTAASDLKAAIHQIPTGRH